MTKIGTLLVSLVIAGGSLGLSFAAEPRAEAERITLNFRDASIQEAFDVLSRKERVNIILSRGVMGNIGQPLRRDGSRCHLPDRRSGGLYGRVPQWRLCGA